MYCIYNYIIINKRTTIIITILLIINVTLNCWSHAYWTPLGYKEGGKWLKIKPKVPPVRNKCLTTCKWHKRDWCTHSFWHQVQYFTSTVTSLLYKIRYKTGLEYLRTLRQSPLPSKMSLLLETVCNMSESLLPLSICAICRILHTNLALAVFFSMLLFVVTLPQRVLSLSFFKWLKCSKGEEIIWH